MPTQKIRAQFRKDTAVFWGVVNPVLLAGELGFETDTKILRIGDGVTAFNSLPKIKLITGEYQLLNTILTAFGALAGAANKIGYFTGSGPITMGLADFTAVGRQIVGANDVAGVRAVLSLTTILFADLDPSTIITDTETLAANKVANGLPTAKAVTDYIDPHLWFELADKTVTGAPAVSVDFTEFNNAVYNDYFIVLNGFLPTTDAVRLLLRSSTNAGSSYDAGASDYSATGYEIEVAGQLNNDTSTGTGINLTGNIKTVGNAAGELGVDGHIYIFNAGIATARTKFHSSVSFDNSAGGFDAVDMKGRRNLAQDTDACRLIFSAGNVAIGSRARLFGKRG